MELFGMHGLAARKCSIAEVIKFDDPYDIPI